MCMVMRDEEGRKKEASKVIQTAKQSNRTHPRQHVNERCRRKEERSKQGQTNKAKQHSTPKAVTFPKKN